jgi:hypothetical protein
MAGALRREWTSREVAEEARESNESLSEATPSRRPPLDAKAGGGEHFAGDEPYEEPDAREAHLVAPDPPLRMDAAEQDHV